VKRWWQHCRRRRPRAALAAPAAELGSPATVASAATCGTQVGWQSAPATPGPITPVASPHRSLGLSPGMETHAAATPGTPATPATPLPALPVTPAMAATPMTSPFDAVTPERCVDVGDLCDAREDARGRWSVGSSLVAEATIGDAFDATPSRERSSGETVTTPAPRVEAAFKSPRSRADSATDAPHPLLSQRADAFATTTSAVKESGDDHATDSINQPPAALVPAAPVSLIPAFVPAAEEAVTGDEKAEAPKLGDVADCSRVAAPPASTSSLKSDASLATTAPLYGAVLDPSFEGDPWDGCAELANEDFIEWLLDFTRLRGTAASAVPPSPAGSGALGAASATPTRASAAVRTHGAADDERLRHQIRTLLTAQAPDPAKLWAPGPKQQKLRGWGGSPCRARSRRSLESVSTSDRLSTQERFLVNDRLSTSTSLSSASQALTTAANSVASLATWLRGDVDEASVTAPSSAWSLGGEVEPGRPLEKPLAPDEKVEESNDVDKASSNIEEWELEFLLCGALAGAADAPTSGALGWTSLATRAPIAQT